MQEQDRMELFALLGVEGPEDFNWFEDFAALMETEEVLPESALGYLLQNVDAVTFAELAGNYFDDVMQFLPEENAEVYNAFFAVKQNLSDAFAGEEDAARRAEDALQVITGFREWYLDEDACRLKNRESGEEKTESMRDALYDNRLARLDGTEYDWELLREPYLPESYVLPLSSLIAGEEDAEQNGTEDAMPELTMRPDAAEPVIDEIRKVVAEPNFTDMDGIEKDK